MSIDDDVNQLFFTQRMLRYAIDELNSANVEQHRRTGAPIAAHELGFTTDDDDEQHEWLNSNTIAWHRRKHHDTINAAENDAGVDRWHARCKKSTRAARDVVLENAGILGFDATGALAGGAGALVAAALDGVDAERVVWRAYKEWVREWTREWERANARKEEEKREKGEEKKKEKKNERAAENAPRKRRATAAVARSPAGGTDTGAPAVLARVLAPDESGTGFEHGDVVETLVAACDFDVAVVLRGVSKGLHALVHSQNPNGTRIQARIESWNHIATARRSVKLENRGDLTPHTDCLDAMGDPLLASRVRRCVDGGLKTPSTICSTIHFLRRVCILRTELAHVGGDLDHTALDRIEREWAAMPDRAQCPADRSTTQTEFVVNWVAERVASVAAAAAAAAGAAAAAAAAAATKA